MKSLLTLLITVALALSGCQKPQPPTNEPVTRIVTVPAFARTAVDAVGGEKAWADTQVIVGECTAKFYKPDGTFYLTRQRHAVYPWSDSIRIYAGEPQGAFVWQLTGASFTLLDGTPEQEAHLPMAICDPHIARATWSVAAAPACIAAQTGPNTAALGQPVRAGGLWHYPIRLRAGQTLYQDIDSNIFDMYTLNLSAANHEPRVTSDEPRAAIITARGYNYLTIEKTSIMTPTKIEIFRADSPAADPQRIIELDYTTLESVGF